MGILQFIELIAETVEKGCHPIQILDLLLKDKE
jgi:hypothetical protein